MGLLLQPGMTVRWVMDSPGNPHTTTAYHPKNANHSLRIPENAPPWDSGFLVNPGDRLEVTFAKEGVHVGRPAGRGTQPFDYFVGKPGTAQWIAVPDAARATFPSIASIMADKVVRLRAFG